MDSWDEIKKEATSSDISKRKDSLSSAIRKLDQALRKNGFGGGGVRNSLLLLAQKTPIPNLLEIMNVNDLRNKFEHEDKATSISETEEAVAVVRSFVESGAIEKATKGGGKQSPKPKTKDNDKQTSASRPFRINVSNFKAASSPVPNLSVTSPQSFKPKKTPAEILWNNSELKFKLEYLEALHIALAYDDATFNQDVRSLQFGGKSRNEVIQDINSAFGESSYFFGSNLADSERDLIEIVTECCGLEGIVAITITITEIYNELKDMFPSLVPVELKIVRENPELWGKLVFIETIRHILVGDEEVFKQYFKEKSLEKVIEEINNMELVKPYHELGLVLASNDVKDIATKIAECFSLKDPVSLASKVMDIYLKLKTMYPFFSSFQSSSDCSRQVTLPIPSSDESDYFDGILNNLADLKK